MNFKEHYRKKDWVYHLTMFLFFVLAVFVVDTILGVGPLGKNLIISVVSGLVILGMEIFFNQMSSDIDKAVEEDKREMKSFEVKNNKKQQYNNIMKKIVFALLALVAMMTSVEAQNVKVKGTVKDAKTGEVLPLVNVGLMRTTDTVFMRGAASDFNGVFEIKDVKLGEYLM